MCVADKYGMVKVYAVGLYVEGTNALDAFAGDAVTPDFYGRLAETSAGFQRTLLLGFHRGVGVSAVVSALRDALTERVGSESGGVGSFEAALLRVLGESVPQGSLLFLGCAATGDLLIGFERAGSREAALAGAPVGETLTGAHAVCDALFDVYLGAKPIAPAAKTGVAAGFEALCAAHFDANRADEPEAAASDPVDEPPKDEV